MNTFFNPNPSTPAPAPLPFAPVSVQPVAAAEPESETKMIEVYCDICAEQMFGSRANLVRYGWGIYAKFCFCPFHEDQV